MADLSTQERNALTRIATLDDPDKLRAFILNARDTSPVIEAAAFQRLCFVQPEATPGTVEHDVWQSIHALEQMYRDQRGRTTRLSRTRQKIARHGEAKTAADLTLKKVASQGFVDLIALGYPQLTFEAVVLRHPRTFDEPVLDAAATRLRDAGLDPDTFCAKEHANG